MEFARRTSTLRPEGAYQVFGRARELEAMGREIIHLEMGQPDFSTPEHISQTGMDAIAEGRTRYTSPAGMPELRAALAAYAGEQRSISVQPEQVAVGPGSKPLMFFPTLALVEPGDEVLYPDPGFPTYEAMISVAGGVPVPVPLREETNFAFDMDAFEKALGPRSRMVILNSPANPTGGVLGQEDLERIAETALRHDMWVLSDEIYARLTFSGETAPSIASLPGMAERTIIADGFSKTYAMTGWRLGFGVMPAELAERVELLLTHATGSTAEFTQIAGLEALRGSHEHLTEMVRAYKTRRDVLVPALNELPGFRCQMPEGAFYAFPNITGTGKTSAELASLLLEEASVATLPGTAFGKGGEGFLRLSFANSLENIERALERISKVI